MYVFRTNILSILREISRKTCAPTSSVTFSVFHRAARLPVDFVKAFLNHTDKGVTGIYARWHTFEEKREAVMAIEAAVLPLMPKANALAA